MSEPQRTPSQNIDSAIEKISVRIFHSTEKESPEQLVKLAEAISALVSARNNCSYIKTTR